MFGVIAKLNTPSKTLYGAAFLLGSFTLISQFMGLIRDRLLAHNFGAGLSLDIYFASFRIPDFVSLIIGSLVAVSVLVPFIVSIGNDGALLKKKLGEIAVWFLMIILILSGLAYFFMPTLLQIVFPGFDDEAMNILIRMSRILLLSPLLLGLSSFLASIAQAKNHFLAYAMSPVFYNLGIIIGIIFLAPFMGLFGLAVGVILGAMMHFVLQIPFILKSGIIPELSMPKDLSLFKSIFSISIWRSLSLSMNHITTIVLMGFASLFATGAIAVFTFANNLQSVLVGVFGSSVSLAAFPVLSKMYNDGKSDDFENTVSDAIKQVLFWIIPAFVFVIVLRAHIVRVVYGSGMFSWQDTRLTAASLALLSISAIAQSVSLVITRAMYATGKTLLPFIANGLGLLASVIAIVVLLALDKQNSLGALYEVLRIGDVEHSSIVLLSLSFAIGSVVSVITLLLAYTKSFTLLANIRQSASEFAVSAITGGIITYTALNIMGDVVGLTSLFRVFFQAFVAGMLGIFTTIFMLIWLKNKEWALFYTSISSRVWRKVKTVYPDTEVV